jgi:2-polyprenyl-6-methoxyphenol hydroxylase-like FAD-dependent oxidoreductase
MVLGFLLARAGIEVAVLEKHADFLRDFRGDTVHPSTLELMYELGLLEEFLTLPHRKVEHLTFQVGAERMRIIDFDHIPTHCKCVVLMPQWDFLNFIARQGKRYQAFDLRMCAEVTALVEESGRIVGVRATTPDGPLIVKADLVVGCDGRHSTVRAQSGLQTYDYGAPMDVLWFRIARKASDPSETFGHIEAGVLMVMLDRGDYWQCAIAIPKGGIDQVKARGIGAFRNRVVALSPFVSDRIGELKSFDEVKLLSVAVNRLQQWWRPGLLCIGDAAHAMSPIGGVGINIAVQDAVATANALVGPLKVGRIADSDLHNVQQRRAVAAYLTQWVQLTMQKRIIAPALQATQTPKTPMLFKLFNTVPPLRRLVARLLGVGFRPEHIHTADVLAGAGESRWVA